MVDFNQQICRLCLVISPTCECETVDEIKKKTLQILQINMDFEISNYAVACNRCLERLQDCFEFKSRIMTTLMDDIKKTSQRKLIGESLCLEKFEECRLCMLLVKEEAYNYTSDLKGAVLLEDMIRNCFPEVDLDTHVRELHTCKQCVSSLKSYYEFMKCCQEVEQKIVHFRQVAGHCIADKVNLDDMLKFKDYDMLGTPLIIKKEYSNIENVDENATKCPKSEDIAIIKCEEIHIKDELDNGKISTYYNSSEDSRSLKEATETRTSASKGKKHSCHKCHYSSDRSNNMKKHMLTHLDNEVHGCTLCSFITNARLSLQAHMASHRGPTKKYGCPECTYETDHKGVIDQHILKHKDNSEVKMYKCPSCPLKTRYKNSLLKHQKELHALQEILKYKCEICNHELKYKCSLARHMQMHADPKVAYKFQCEECLYKTRWKRNLKRHVMTHSIKHPYSCDQCTFSSKFSMNLRVHKRVHQKKGEERYKCNLCTYQAKTTKSVRFHMIKAHTDPSEVSKLKCTHCPYKTIIKQNLLRHIKRWHGIENRPKLKCDLCTYITTDKEYMQQHVIVHQEATIQCYQCDFRTRWRSSLQTHMKRHQVGSRSPTKQQTISRRGDKNRNLKTKNDDKKKE